MRAVTVGQQKLVKTMKEYKDPITIEELSLLLTWPLSRTYNIFRTLRNSGKLLVDNSKVKSKEGGRAKSKYQFVYFGTKQPKKDPIKEYFNEEGEPHGGINTLNVALGEQKSKPVTTNHPAINERCNVDRGYHFLKAGISKSSGEFADFFGISEEQAMRLLATIASRYPSEIKVTMRACLHNISETTSV